MKPLFLVPSIKEVERRRRILLALWAYAYEFENDSIVTDDKFDRACKKVDLTVNTGNEKMDKWWIENFNPSTGQWIRNHPELYKIRRIYNVNHGIAQKRR